MGNACNCEAAREEVEELTAAASEKAAAVVEAVETAAQKVEDALPEPVKEKIEEVKEAVAQVAEDVKEKVEEVVTEVKEGLEAMGGTMEAATAAVTNTMIVEFQWYNGKTAQTKVVDFKSKETGFSHGVSGGGCCVTAGTQKLVVTKVVPGKQADKNGVKTKWAIYKVNGAEAKDVGEARKLLDEALAKLPDTEA